MGNSLTNKKLTIRFFVDSDFDKISQLRKSFTTRTIRNREASYYRWKLLYNPFQEGLLHVADDEGYVASMTTVTPKRFLINGKVQDGAEIGDTYTHFNYQRRGLFTALVNITRERALEKGLHFIYGAPNEKSLPGYEKNCNFQQIPSAKVLSLVRPINMIPILLTMGIWPFPTKILGSILTLGFKLFHAIPSSQPGRQGIKISQVSEFPKDIYSLFEKVSKNYDWILDRSLTYLKWRYLKNPDSYSIWVAERNSETSGYLVIKVGKWQSLKVAYLADFLSDESSPEIFISLFLHAISKLSQDGIDMLSVWTAANSFYHKILKRYGFIKHEKCPIICYKNTLGNEIIAEKQARWHFTMADSDII